MEIGPENLLSLEDFEAVLNKKIDLSISTKSQNRLVETRHFVDYLLENEIKVYGLTTGFADLRDTCVPASQTAQLSRNIIQSHDAAIGEDLPSEVVRGAMIIRANSLSKGNSGVQPCTLQTLVDMINADIIPKVPSTGSLGASGDLALLARLGRAMMGDPVPVEYEGEVVLASTALQKAGILPFQPAAKEGLALTNGTSFMSAMNAIALLKEIHCLDNLFALLTLFLNSVEAIDAAFYDSVHLVRHHPGQRFVAKFIRTVLKDSNWIDTSGTQNDYCIRCLPQILGPKLEVIKEHLQRTCFELDAVTDNPLIFKNDEISDDVHASRIVSFKGDRWVVISAGNFHGEYLTTIADTLLASNAKIALTIERQMTYLLNPFRNKNKLPSYLIPNREKAGLNSGFMITQYTGNALAQKICSLALPTEMFNLTSGNESEDIVSYGATANENLLRQLDLLEQLLSIYLTMAAQSYSIRRLEQPSKKSLLADSIFEVIQKGFPCALPLMEDRSFDELFRSARRIVSSSQLIDLLPLTFQHFLSPSPRESKKCVKQLASQLRSPSQEGSFFLNNQT